MTSATCVLLSIPRGIYFDQSIFLSYLSYRNDLQAWSIDRINNMDIF